MPAPFAALQTRLNDSVVNNLANKTLVIDSVPVDGIFRSEPVLTGMVETNRVVFIAKTNDLSDPAHGSVAVDGAVIYYIVGVLDDSDGMTKLILELQ